MSATANSLSSNTAIDHLAQEAVAAARACGATLVTAESCTVGAVANALSRVRGAGELLQGGFITYTKDMKAHTLGVPMALLQSRTAVCAEVAEAMALGALQRSPATLAVAVTGVAGPDKDEDGNPVGLVFCCAARSGVRPLVARFQFDGLKPDDIVAAAVCESLRLLKGACGRP